MSDFARGARVKPKAPEPLQGRLKEEVNYPSFVVYMAHTAINEYGQKNKEEFLRHLSVAFDEMLKMQHQGKSDG